MLLERRSLSAADAIEHLVGMQAQAPDAPYVGLWTRLENFRHDELSRAVAERRAVRTHLMRVTIHLVTARDCCLLRPLFNPIMERGFVGSPFSKKIAGVDLGELTDAARMLMDERPRTRVELGASLAERWPGRDALSLAYAAGLLLPVVQIPPRGIWGAGGSPTWATVENWLGCELDTGSSADELVTRYLGAFGPATVKDMQSWSGMTRLRRVVDRLRPHLATFRDEQGNELFDLPEAPRPDPATPAPVRFLPEYDNVLLSHADRTRIMAADFRVPLYPGNGGTFGTLLVDGFIAGMWKIVRERAAATLLIHPIVALTKRDRDAVADEGRGLLAFAAEADRHEVQFAPVP